MKPKPMSLDELTHDAGVFEKVYLENKNELIEFGVPTKYPRISWLISRFIPLYYENINALIKYHDYRDVFHSIDARCKFKELNDSQREYLLTLRDKFHLMKTGILTRLVKARQQGRTKTLWIDCIGEMVEKFTKEDFDFLIDLEKSYILTDRKNEVPLDKIPIPPCGGIINTFEFVGHFAEELNVGLYRKTKDALNGLLLIGKRPIRLTVASYYKVLGTPDESILEKALAAFSGSHQEAKNFWDEFSKGLNEETSGKFEVKLEIPFPTEAKMLNSRASRFVDYTSFSSANLVIRHTKGKTVGALPDFPSLTNLRWEEVTITFVSEQAVKIQARNVSKVCNFTELGCKDGRTGEFPDARWKLLQLFAKHNGSLSWETLGLDRKAHNNMKAGVKDLRKRLRAALRIHDDPFYPYRKEKEYRTRFVIQDGSPSVTSPSR